MHLSPPLIDPVSQCRANLTNPPTLVARIAAALVVSISLAASVHAQSPNPPFPVGTLTVTPMEVATGSSAMLTWDIQLPENTEPGSYVHIIRQVQYPDGLTWDIAVTQAGQMVSLVPIVPVGSRFELWTVGGAPQTACLLDTTLAGPYLPQANVTIHSEDPYPVLPRTRADRLFYIDVTVNGLLSDEYAPDSSKGVTLGRHVQAYGATGTGAGLDRNQATLLTQTPISTNGAQTLTFAATLIPAADSEKARGEERFTLWTRQDHTMPETVIDSKFIQIWPLADGIITGITEGQTIAPEAPSVTLALNDLYPSSTTWTQVYKGEPQLPHSGTIIPGSTVVLNSSVPENRVIQLSDYGSVFDSDGQWTMDILTETPFGTDRVTSVSFMMQGLGMTIEGWRQAQFGSTENNGDAADLGDFDKDGLPNLVEFAFALDPKRNSAGQLPAPQNVEDNRVISFTQPEGIIGITYGAEWSPSLLPDSWTPVPDTAAPPQHTFSVPAGTYPNLFLRLKVTRP